VERGAIGGQAGSTSLIRNYLGFPRGVSGSELAQRAYQQAWVLGARMLLMSEVTGLEPAGGRYRIALSDGSAASAPAVVLATGVSYRLIGIPEIDELVGRGVFYGAAVSEARALAGRRVCVVGGGNSAGQAAVHLARSACTVTLAVRGPSLDAGMSRYLHHEIEAADNIDVRLNTEVVAGGGSGWLERVTLRDGRSGASEETDAAALFILIGARPHTDWLAGTVARDPGGYVLTGFQLSGDVDGGAPWPLDRAPHPFESSLPGVFAVGDVRSGAVKRVASAAGQGSVVISQVHEYLAARAREPHAARSAAPPP
jgi:thioredoxin reductase (NADPH)